MRRRASKLEAPWLEVCPPEPVEPGRSPGTLATATRDLPPLARRRSLARAGAVPPVGVARGQGVSTLGPLVEPARCGHMPTLTLRRGASAWGPIVGRYGTGAVGAVGANDSSASGEQCAWRRLCHPARCDVCGSAPRPAASALARLRLHLRAGGASATSCGGGSRWFRGRRGCGRTRRGMRQPSHQRSPIGDLGRRRCGPRGRRVDPRVQAAAGTAGSRAPAGRGADRPSRPVRRGSSR